MDRYEQSDNNYWHTCSPYIMLCNRRKTPSKVSLSFYTRINVKVLFQLLQFGFWSMSRSYSSATNVVSQLRTANSHCSQKICFKLLFFIIPVQSTNQDQSNHSATSGTVLFLLFCILISSFGKNSSCSLIMEVKHNKLSQLWCWDASLV